MIVGQKFDCVFVVDEKIHSGFMELFSDKNPLHTSRLFARQKGFQSEVMHGNILGGFISYFIGERLPVNNVIIHSQEIKYLSPVYLNDRLIFAAEITEVVDSVKVVRFKFSFLKQDQKMVAKGSVQISII